MTLLATQFFIEVAGIAADPSVLGETFTVKRGSHVYRIEFPTEPKLHGIAGTSVTEGVALDPATREHPMSELTDVAEGRGVQSLFTVRSKIAHTGVTVARGEAATHVQAAWDAFTLMNERAGPPNPDELPLAEARHVQAEQSVGAERATLSPLCSEPSAC